MALNASVSKTTTIRANVEAYSNSNRIPKHDDAARHGYSVASRRVGYLVPAGTKVRHSANGRIGIRSGWECRRSPPGINFDPLSGVPQLYYDQGGTDKGGPLLYIQERMSNVGLQTANQLQLGMASSANIIRNSTALPLYTSLR